MNTIFNPTHSMYLSVLSVLQQPIEKIVHQNIRFRFNVMDRITNLERIGL